MRIRLLVLIVCFLSAIAGAAPAAEPETPDPEVLLGRVETVNRETGEVTVTVLGGAEEGAEPELMTLTLDPGALSDEVLPGVMVRAWGHFPEEGTGIGSPVFSALRIRPMGPRAHMRPGGDPTGVRHRLGLRRRMGPGGPMGGGRR